jgi:hypothetical protein
MNEAHPELRAALAAVEGVQNAIRRADAKAAALAGFELSVVALAFQPIGPLTGDIPHGTPWVWTANAATASLIAGVVVSLALLGGAIWPRLDADRTNRFAFPALAAGARPADCAPGVLSDDAWALAMQLSRTARRKFQLIRGALWTMTASLLGIVGWLCIAMSLT